MTLVNTVCLIVGLRLCTLQLRFLTVAYQPDKFSNYFSQKLPAGLQAGRRCMATRVDHDGLIVFYTDYKRIPREKDEQSWYAGCLDRELSASNPVI